MRRRSFKAQDGIVQMERLEGNAGRDFVLNALRSSSLQKIVARYRCFIILSHAEFNVEQNGYL